MTNQPRKRLPTMLELLGKLPKIKYERPAGAERDRFEQVHLAASLRLLARLGVEEEAALTRTTASHLLDRLPQPDDGDLTDT